jgi:hypothetical protein
MCDLVDTSPVVTSAINILMQRFTSHLTLLEMSLMRFCYGNHHLMTKGVYACM